MIPKALLVRLGSLGVTMKNYEVLGVGI